MKTGQPIRFTILAATLAVVAGMVALMVLHHPQGKSLAEISSVPVISTNASDAAVPIVNIERNVDREAVLAAFREANPIQRAVLFGRSFADWFQHDPEAALAWLRQMPQGPEYTQGMFIALQGICKTDPRRALVLAADMATTHEQKFIYNALFEQLAKNDPASVAGWLSSVPAGEARENALRAVADNWSASDTAGALEWARNLEDSGERATAMESILTAMAETNPQQTMELAKQNLDGGALDRVMQKSLKDFAAENPAAAADVVSQLPEGELQRNSAVEVARALAEEDPAKALAWMQTLPADAQAVALDNTLNVWLKQDAGAAGKYLADMTAGAAQDAAVSRFAENWAAQDVNAAIAWADNLGSGSAQSAAVVSIASGWARTDAVAATQWAASLPADDPARAEALKGAYSYWELADTTAAANYLKTLSPTDQTAIKPGSLVQN